MRRRRAMGVSMAVAIGAAVSACGFTLRGAPPMAFRSVALVGFAPRSTLERALRDQLSQTARIEPLPARADVVLQALSDARDRVAVVTSASGQVRELQLRVRFAWRVSTPRGQVLMDVQELLLTRDLSYSETATLAKEMEAEVLFAAMDEDIALQVMRRLSTVKTA